MLGGQVDRRLRGSARGKASGPRFRLPGDRRWWFAGGAGVVLLVAGLLVWAWWPESGPEPRSRVYTEATACLLTPAAGVADKQAAPVWAGMQRASLATRGKIQFLEVDGPQTGENAKTFLATLVSGRCDVILTAGAAPNAALVASAAAYPDVRFVLVGNLPPQGNISVVDAESPDLVSAQVEQQVTAVLTAAADD